MSNNECSESQSAGYNVTVPLSGAAIEVLGQLFIMGPTYDGDVASKSGRDELYGLKLIGRCEGYQFLTATGIRMALANQLDRKKQSRYRDERARLVKLDQIETIMWPSMAAQGESVAMGLCEQVAPRDRP